MPSKFPTMPLAKLHIQNQTNLTMNQMLTQSLATTSRALLWTCMLSTIHIWSVGPCLVSSLNKSQYMTTKLKLKSMTNGPKICIYPAQPRGKLQKKKWPPLRPKTRLEQRFASPSTILSSNRYISVWLSNKHLPVMISLTLNLMCAEPQSNAQPPQLLETLSMMYILSQTLHLLIVNCLIVTKPHFIMDLFLCHNINWISAS